MEDWGWLILKGASPAGKILLAGCAGRSWAVLLTRLPERAHKAADPAGRTQPIFSAGTF